jgi:hypothetical protein
MHQTTNARGNTEIPGGVWELEICRLFDTWRLEFPIAD